MEYIYGVWEDVDDLRSNGGGNFLVGLFRKESDAKKCAEMLHTKMLETPERARITEYNVRKVLID